MGIFMPTHDPWFRAIIIVYVEDGEVRRVQLVTDSEVFASLRDPTGSPVVPNRVSRVQVV
jgi:hypothetical protein